MQNYNSKINTLNNHLQQPSLGFGTWQLTGKTGFEAVSNALTIGYRHIDTAAIYGNHQEIGQALIASGINREDIFITSKIWKNDLQKTRLLSSFETILKDLQIDYIDQLLIHWPNKNADTKDVLKTMSSFVESGVVKSIGVSNCTINHLKDIMSYGIDIQVNQVEIHPSFQQFELVKFCHDNQITVTAYTPLGQGYDLQIPKIVEIANKYNVPSNHVVISFLLSQNLIAIPKATKYENIKSNFEAQDLVLANDEIEEIKNLDKNRRLINPSFSEFDY
jgi:diketogulonate reductase-like aldo/keto reductase